LKNVTLKNVNSKNVTLKNVNSKNVNLSFRVQRGISFFDARRAQQIPR
jgi:hypothetical protein